MTVLARLAPASLPAQRIKFWLLALLVTGTAFALGYAFAGRPLLATIGAVGVVTLLVSLVRPNAATYIVVAILYSNAAAIAVREHGLPDFVGLAFPLALALPLADHLLLRRKTITITKALPYLFGFLFVQVLGAAAAREPSDALSNLIVFVVSGFGLYFVMTNVVRSFATLRYAVWTVLLVGAGLGLLSTFQAITGSYGNDYLGFSTVNLPGRGTEQLTARLDGTPRHEGPIGEVNRYGQIMLVLVPIGAVVAIGERRRLLKIAAILATLLILFGMATSFSRGAAFGLAVILVAATILRYLRPIHLLILIVALLTALIAFPTYGERLIGLQALTRLDRTQGGAPVAGDTGNLRGRATSTLAALFVFADHPFIGVGRGQFSSYYRDYAESVAGTGVDTRIDAEEREAHNLYTSIAAETGLLGFACFAGVFLVTLRDLYRARRRWLKEHPEVAHLATGFILAIFGYLASGMALHLAYERYLWLLLALAGVTAHLALKGNEANDFEVDTGKSPSTSSMRSAMPAS